MIYPMKNISYKIKLAILIALISSLKVEASDSALSNEVLEKLERNRAIMNIFENVQIKKNVDGHSNEHPLDVFFYFKTFKQLMRNLSLNEFKDEDF